jgi:hypothetical protein
VSIFTVTLFLSGYVLQQRTVNNIREAIKPQIRPAHKFAVETLPAPSATTIPSTPGGVQIIEVPGTSEDIPQQEVVSSEAGSTVSQDVKQKGKSRVEQMYEWHAREQKVVVNDDTSVVSERRKPSQVENDKKDKAWAAKLRERMSKKTKEEIPVDLMSRAARRKLYKEQLAVQEGQQRQDPNRYRPRRRLW